ncbi:MAG: helix-turn-helix domain-containing protein [Planctomycetota bacterium]|jgi:excisionase family DNA binding protein
MAKSGEFYTFDEVVRQLKIDQNKLKRLVSEGEISAFREGDVMKFKKSEIDKLAQKGTGSETSETVLSEITLEDEAPAFEESGETLTDDLVFESAESEDQVDLADVGAGPEEISSQDTFIEDRGAPEDEIGMSTEPIDLSADLTQEVDEDEDLEEVEAPALRAAAAPRTSRRAVAEAPAGNPGITFALVLTAIIMLLGVSVSFRASGNEISGEEPRQLTGMFEKISNWFYGMGSNDTVEKAIRQTSQPITDAHRSAVPDQGGG